MTRKEYLKILLASAFAIFGSFLSVRESLAISSKGRLDYDKGKVILDSKDISDLDKRLNEVIYKGASAPSNTTYLWIDTANKGIVKYYNGSSWVTVTSAWG